MMACSGILIMSGCMASTKNLNPDDENHYDASYDFSDKKQPKQMRLYKKERIYYSLDLTISDLKTGEIVYADQAELAREASKPIIGW